MMYRLFCTTFLLLVSALTFASDTIPKREYVLANSHASRILRVDHLGFSMYTARFLRFDARLSFDPENLAASALTATVDATSIETGFPTPEIVDFNAFSGPAMRVMTPRTPKCRVRVIT